MGLILIIAGIVGGWKAADPFDRYGLAALAVFAAFLEGLMLLLFSGFIGPFELSDSWMILADWLVLFLYGAIPFMIAGWLKRSQLRNRAGE